MKLRFMKQQCSSNKTQGGKKMPTIICSWCEYVGQGDDFADRIQDVLNHEKTCPEKVLLKIK